MAKDAVQIRKFDGVSTLYSKEDSPIEVTQELVNLRPAYRVGRAVKRRSYTDVTNLTGTAITTVKEYVNRNGDIVFALIDNNAFKRSIYSAGYGVIANADNDSRRSTATLYGAETNPVIADNSLRSGAGLNASTDIPFWHGYIDTRNRFNSNVTINAGRYLCEQGSVDYGLIVSFQQILDVTVTTHTNEFNTQGVTADKMWAVFASFVLDGYQRGFPIKVASYTSSLLATGSSLKIKVKWKQNFVTLWPRVTAIDLFIAPADNEIDILDYATRGRLEANFLERIDINDDSQPIYTTTCTGSGTTPEISIPNNTTWKTFDPVGMWVKFTGTGNYYRITTDTDNAGTTELDVDGTLAAGDQGAGKEIQFLSRWYPDGSDYTYMTIYDNYYKLVGSEMYDYLNIPAGDTGLSDFRYKYGAWNGNRYWIGGLPDDANFSYYSVTNSPDIIPSQNIIRHKQDVKGGVNIGDDFLVFTEIGVERIRIYDNTDAVQDDEYLNVRLTHHRSIAKVDDDTIAFMSYDGPHIISGRRVIPIGKHLNKWWIETFTKAQMEACVAGYNHIYNELWFSFPTYTTSPYTNGIIFVFDIGAWRAGPSLVSATSPDVPHYLSPWWIVKTDTPIYDFELNNQNVLLGAGLTKVVDFDSTGGTETVDTSFKMKMLQNGIPNKKVWWDRIFVDVETDDTVSGTLYYDGSSSGVALTLNSDLTGFIRYISKTLEVELTTTASTNTVEHKGLVLFFTPKRVV